MSTMLISLQESCSSIRVTISFQLVIKVEKIPIQSPMGTGLYTQSTIDFIATENSQKDLALLGLALNTAIAAGTDLYSNIKLKSPN